VTTAVAVAPAAARVGLLADAHLALDEQPALALIAVLLADEVGMVREQLLEDALGVVGLLCHLDQRGTVLDVDGHRSLSRRCQSTSPRAGGRAAGTRVRRADHHEREA
jgi:hypothetical protein